jgi:hypothetical protein
LEFSLCLIFTIFLYFKYADKKTSYWICFLTIFVWFLNFLVAVVVPFDILLVNRNKEKNLLKNLLKN